MFRRMFLGGLLAGVVLLAGCYAVKPYTPQEVKPGWEITEVTLTNGRVITFDEPALLDSGAIVGGVQDDMLEILTRRVPLDSICKMQVKRPEMTTASWAAVGVGAGVGVFLVAAVLNQHRTKDPHGQGGNPDDGGIGVDP